MLLAEPLDGRTKRFLRVRRAARVSNNYAVNAGWTTRLRRDNLAEKETDIAQSQ